MQIKCFILNLDRVDIGPESKIDNLVQGMLRAQSRIRSNVSTQVHQDPHTCLMYGFMPEWLMYT